jgi:hypothetical protein
VAHSSSRRDRAGLWLVVLALLVGGALAVLAHVRRDAREMVAHEDAALAALHALLAAETRHRETSGRYGWLDEVTPLLPGGAAAAEAPGYRIDVLLPGGRDALGHVELVERSRAAHDPLLAARHVALVARPLEPGRSGWRTFYLDETARVYVSEGVFDWQSASLNALPRVRVEGPQLPSQPGPVWRPLDDLEGTTPGGDAAKD